MNKVPQRRPLLLMILLGLAMVIGGCAHDPKDDPEDLKNEDPSFSMLILGDSQMAGAGWAGGYENCILETYPHATVVNLAQSGHLLASGEIHSQWEYYLSQTTVMPDLVLLDGGINDLPHLQKEEFRETGLTLVSNGLCTLIEHIHTVSPDTHIIYTLMPPFAEWEDVEYGIPSYEAQKHYWEQLRIIASTYDYVTVVDLFTIDPFQYPNVESYQKHLADSIHFSEAGYRKTFEYINHAIVPHLVQR